MALVHHTTTRIMRIALACVALAVGIVVATPTSASACKCAPSATADSAERADLVVIGTISGVHNDYDEDYDGSRPTTYTVQVESSFKEPVAHEIDFINFPFCGVEGVKVGERDVFYLDGDNAWRRWSAGWCGGDITSPSAEVARQIVQTVGPAMSTYPQPGSDASRQTGTSAEPAPEYGAKTDMSGTDPGLCRFDGPRATVKANGAAQGTNVTGWASHPV